MKPGRNDPCHCGSGQKYKKCCLPKDDAARSAELAAQAAEAARLAAEALAAAEEGEDGEPAPAGAPKAPSHGRDKVPAAPRAKAGEGRAPPAIRRKAI